MVEALPVCKVTQSPDKKINFVLIFKECNINNETKTAQPEKYDGKEMEENYARFNRLVNTHRNTKEKLSQIASPNNRKSWIARR